MTPYKKFYYYIIGCLNHFFFRQEKETLHLWPHLKGVCNKKLLVLNNLQCHYYEYSNKRKSACSLRSPIGSKGRSPPLISSWSHASWWNERSASAPWSRRRPKRASTFSLVKRFFFLREKEMVQTPYYVIIKFFIWGHI